MKTRKRSYNLLLHGQYKKTDCHSLNIILRKLGYSHNSYCRNSCYCHHLHDVCKFGCCGTQQTLITVASTCISLEVIAVPITLVGRL